MSILNLFTFKTIVEHYRTFSLGLLLAPVSIRVGVAIVPVVGISVGVWVVAVVAVGQPGVGLGIGISGGLSISRPLAIVGIRVTVVSSVSSITIAVSQPGIGLSIGSGLGISGGLSISRPLAVVSVGVTVVSSVSSITIAVRVIAIAISQPGIGLSIGSRLGISGGLSIGRPLAVVSVGVAIVSSVSSITIAVRVI